LKLSEEQLFLFNQNWAAKGTTSAHPDLNALK
jgi:hypothetical protein